MSTNDASETRTALLRNQAVSFTRAFLAGSTPQDILDEYFTPTAPQITEHGPEWAQTRLPFLGRTFVGRSTTTTTSGSNSDSTCDEYFRLLSKALDFIAERSSFPPPEEYVVDASNGKGVVVVVGRGTFRSVETGVEWGEMFVHRLSGFDDRGRIGRWEIWADPLSAWRAVQGL